MILIVIAAFIAGFVAYIEEKRPGWGAYKRADPFGEEFWFLFGVRVVDLVSPKSWRSFIVGTVTGLLLPPPHILEQIYVRQLLCPECIVKCTVCKCSGDKMYDPNASCTGRKWGPMDKQKEDWEDRKEKYKIKIELKIG